MKRAGWLSLVLVLLLIVACDESSDGDSEGASSTAGGSGSSQNQVSYGGQEYALKSGLEEVFRPKFLENHSASQLNITNGRFYWQDIPVGITVGSGSWQTRSASVWMYMDVYSPGSKGLKSGTFNYVADSIDENDSSLASKFFFQEGTFAVDMDGDGNLESKAGEYLEIVGGRVSLEKKGRIYKLGFRLSLENGVTVQGSYTGDFTQV